MRALRIAAVAVLVAGCGGSVKTVTVTSPPTSKTVTVTTHSPASATTVTTTSTPSPTPATAAGAPIPLGQAADIGNGWTLKVESMTSTAANAPAGAREVTLSVVLGYRGSGESIAPLGLGRPIAEGSHHVPYNWQGCGGPGLDLREEANAGGIKLFSGAETHNGICFEVASNDVASLQMLLPASSTLNRTKLPAVTFAVR